MNVRGRLVSGLILFAIISPVCGFDLVAPFDDPLLTLPSVVKTGSTLPGDDEPIPCPSGRNFSKPLSLAEAVDIALCNNPQIKSTWANIKIQAGILGEARAAYLPTLSGTVSRLQSRTSYPDTGYSSSKMEGRTIYGTFNWRLFDFGERDANRASANSLLIAAVANHDATLQKILVEVVQAYFDAQTQDADWHAKEESETLARSTLETTQRREDRGASSRGDTLQADTALAKATLEKNRAAGSYQKALSILTYTLGVPPQTQISLAEDMCNPEHGEAKDLAAWLDIAESSHPAIRAARAQWESAKQKIISTRSQGLPTVDFSASTYQNGYPGQGLTTVQQRVNNVGVTLTIPIFDGFSRTYKIREAEAQAEQSEAQLQDTEHSILMEVVKAYADAMAAVQNLDASERLLDAAKASLDSSQRKYEKGATDILEILHTQAALADAQQERVRSLSEWRSARLRLLANAGVMGLKSVEP